MQRPHSSDAQLIAELNHEINSPLAAIRNALYLAGCRSNDPDLHHYLRLADQEIAAIAGSLKRARDRIEQLAEAEVALLADIPLQARQKAAA